MSYKDDSLMKKKFFVKLLNFNKYISLCMFFLEKMHIGEVQSSIWPVDIIEQCKQQNIHLL